jgi:hypothetical protein
MVALATREDLLAVPAPPIAEIINSVLAAQPRPAAPHALAASVIGMEIGGPFHRGQGGPGGWIPLFEPELQLPDGNVVVPDFAGWRRQRMPAVPRTAGFELAPDWLCEVLSRSTDPIDRVDKLPIYATARVAHVWLIDPIVRTLELRRLDGETCRIIATWRDAVVVRAEPFDAVELELAALRGE